MKFEKARKSITYLLIIGMLICALGLISTKSGSEGRALVTLAAIGVVLLAALIWALWCKCPYCGKHLFRKALSLEKCPYCKTSFKNPPKGKGKGKNSKNKNPYDSAAKSKNPRL